MNDKLHEFETPAIKVRWSLKRCIHAAECVYGLPTVFEPGRRPWIDAAAASPDAIAETIRRCPTGALHYERLDGGASEPVPGTNTVRLSRNGPVYVRGDVVVHADDGTELLHDTRVALCRCGGSKNAPLCDNTHLEQGFREGGGIADESRVEETPVDGGALHVRPIANGPLKLDGPFAIGSADGRTMLAGSSTKLCRCGGSSNKPFCDGTHKTNGFTTG